MVGIHVSRYRECIDVLRFLKRCLLYLVFVTDGGPWYRWPAQGLELMHVVLVGGIRSYIERLFETVKDRMRAFDCFFPTSGIESVRGSAKRLPIFTQVQVALVGQRITFRRWKRIKGMGGGVYLNVITSGHAIFNRLATICQKGSSSECSLFMYARR